MIFSRQNQHVQYLLKLCRRQDFRYQQQCLVTEGTTLLAQVNPTAVNLVFIARSLLPHPEVREILNRIEPSKQLVITDELYRKISNLEHARELIAIVNMPWAVDFTAAAAADCLVLEHIQDPGNLGTMIRAAAAAGVGHLLMSADCADVFMPKVIRSAMGAHFLLQLYPKTDLLTFLKNYQGAIYLTTLNPAASNLYNLDLTAAATAAWVVGNEGTGLSSDIMNLRLPNLKRVAIPMPGRTESLNAALAAGICLFEQVRQRQKSAALP